MKLFLIIFLVILALNALICYCALCIASQEDRWMEEHLPNADQITQNRFKSL